MGCNGGGGGTGGGGTATGSLTKGTTGTTGTGGGMGSTGGTTLDEPDYPGPGEGTDDIGGKADPSRLPPVPRSIGSGLPYDVRVQVGDGDVGQMSAVPEGDWGQARPVTDATAAGSRALGLEKLGFFALQTGVRQAQVTANGPAEPWSLSFADDGLYMLDPDSNLRTETTVSLYRPDLASAVFESFEAYHPLVGEGLRPLAVEMFVTEAVGTGGPVYGHAVTWVLDGHPGPWEVAFLPEGAMTDRIAEAAGEGLRVLSLSSRPAATPEGEAQYAAIFLSDPIAPEDTEVYMGIDETDLVSLAADVLLGGGQVPYSVVSRGGRGVFDVLTAKRVPMQQAVMAVGLDEAGMRNEDTTRRKEGWHLVTAASYQEGGGEPRWVGVWQKVGPVLAQLREPDLASLGPWDGAEAKVLQLAQGADDGPTPSQQMAVLMGDQVSFQGAYTFAPVTWPQTWHESAFPVGSLSKSFVAAVVVQALADGGQGLDVPLVDVMGWDPSEFTDGSGEPDDRDYTGIGVVTIRDLLLHRAGFQSADPTETSTQLWRDVYYDHLQEQMQLAAMGASADARRLPLSSMSLERWMLGILRGEIDPPNDPMTGKDLGIWKPEYKSDPYAYSNVTYSILGLVADEVAPQGLVGALREYAEQAGAESVWPLNDTRLPRRGIVHPIRNHRTKHLGVQVSPYGPDAGGDAAEPAFEEEDPFGFLRPQVSEWPRLAVPQTPKSVHGGSYSAKQSLRGQTVGAGGFEGSATDLARLFRALLSGASKGGVLSDAVALSLRVIDPAGDPNLASEQCPWCDGYGLGFYLYHNWVIGAGVVEAAGSLVAYNTAYDITFAWVGNWGEESPLTLFDDDFFDALEEFWPCQEDPQTPRDDCPTNFTTVIGGGGTP